MFWWSHERTLEWLMAQGATRSADAGWSWVGSPDPLSNNDLAHELVDVALEDPSLSPSDRLQLGFGLLDLLDDYAVAMYLTWEFTGVDASHRDELDLVWDYCREILERPEESESVPYWLWVEWFEDLKTVRTAFERVAASWDQTGISPAGDRRIDRVLRVSGPVPWDVKEPVYRAALARPDLHPALLEALRGSFHDLYGKIDSAVALELIQQFHLNKELKSEARSLATAIRGSR